MGFKERFLNYVKFDTTSSEEYKNRPSNANEYELAKQLKYELEQLGVENIRINEFATIYGYLPGDPSRDSIYLIAHLDTSNQASGKNVKARSVIYDGQPVELSKGIYLSEDEFDSLKEKVGHELIVTDGTTLLGGDDKAGIAIIMSLLEYLHLNPKVKHCPIEVIFNSDEEIGIGASHITTSLIQSKYGYTIDGGALKYINVENFNAASLDVKIKGRSIHPGDAKDKMINSINVGYEFHSALPAYLRPEHTEGRVGFYHLCNISGNEEFTEMNYIVREHSRTKLNNMLEIARLAANRINEKYHKNIIELDIKNQYNNMKDIIDKNKDITARIESAYKTLGIHYEFEPIRGGTDGAQLTFMGFPTPNIATGDYNCHGRFEYVDVEESKTVIKILLEMVKTQ